MSACTHVTERAIVGPCARPGCTESRPMHNRSGWHPYLGPVLARCGHGEGEHWDDTDGPSFCDDCLGPLLARCGHEEAEHPPEQQGIACGACAGDGVEDIYLYHAFTDVN